VPVNQAIPTEGGFVNLIDISEGDYVLGSDGKPNKVVKLHPIESQDTYKLSFSDGTVQECSGNHLWNAWRANQAVTINGKRVSGVASQKTVDTLKLLEWVSKAKIASGTKRYPLLPLSGEVTFNKKELQIDPYTLGLLLGDGCITEKANTTITTIDSSIREYLQGKFPAGVSVDSKIGTEAVAVRFKGSTLVALKQKLETLDLYGRDSKTKFVPKNYLQSSIEDRYEILQGLLDTDGTVDKRGQVYFYSCSKELAVGVRSLVESLGGVCTMTSKLGKYKDKEGNTVSCSEYFTVRIKHREPHKLFKLHRKLERVKVCQGFYRKLIDIEVLPAQDMRCITVEREDGLFLTGDRFLVTHNSELLAMRPLEYVNDPNFSGVFFRRQYAELTGAGGLWDKSKKMYPEFKAKPNISNLRWDFPTGAQVRMSHMHTEDSKESHRGLQYSFIGFDEIDQFSKDQVQFLLTCLRSEADMDSFCIGTCNPNPDSWVLELVKWYLDEEGTPREDRCGTIRYYIVLDGDFVFGESEEYFKENYPDAVFVHNPTTKEDIYIPPKTFTYIPGNIFDNPALIEANPRYLSELQNLPDHERARQLWGNWYARPSGSSSWERSWLVGADRVPANSRGVRAYDLAAKEPSEVYRHPDATVSVQMWKCPQGYYYLTGNYHPKFIDNVDNKEVYGRVRKRIGDRNNVMFDQCELDGIDIPVVLPQDVGAAGIQALEDLQKQFASRGYRTMKDPMPTTRGKLLRFLPFADASQNGLVRIVLETFPNQDTLNYIFKELEAFDGERSTAHRKDDFPDAIATAYNALNKQAVHTPAIFSAINSPTLISNLR
jgi:phage terminase large subunit-like protein